MKHLITFLFLFGTYTVCFAQDINVSLEPNPVLQNEMATLSLSASGDIKIDRIEFPMVDGVTFHPNASSQSTQIINGHKTISIGYGIMVNKKGRVTIPAFKVYTNKGVKTTRPYAFTVGKRSLGITKANGEDAEISDVTKMWARIPGNKKIFYVGEMIPLEVALAYNERLPFDVRSYPEVAPHSEIIFKQYQIPQSGASIQFDPEKIMQSNTTIDGQSFRDIIFSGQFRALKPGKYKLNISGALMLRQRNPSPSFFDFEDRLIPCPLSTQLTNLIVEPLPPPPEHAINLALISPNTPIISLESKSPKMGETITLELLFSGSVDGLKTPDLTLDGFRVFPPEQTTLSQGKTRIRYLIVPLRTGKQNLNITFATFDSYTGKWKETSFSKVLDVEKSEQILVTQPTTPNGIPNTETQLLGSDILYIKPLASETLMSPATRPPHWKNGFQSAGLIVLFSTIALAISELLLWHKRKSDQNPHFLRRKNAIKRKGSLIKKIQEATEETFESIVRTDVVDYIVDLKQLPQGTDIYLLEKSIKNSALIELLKSAENASYRIGSQCENLKEKANILIKMIKKGAFTLFLTFILSQTVLASNDTSLEKGKLANLTDAIIIAEKSYAEGNFERAYQAYQTISDLSTNNANVWFNLGNCAYQLKRFPESLLYYERALRYDPANDDILANLNACCTQLGVPLRGEVNNPLDFLRILRDELRPSGWIIFTSAGIALLLLIVARGRWHFSNRIWVGGGVSLLMILFGCIMFIWQNKVLYAQNEAIIIAKSATVWNLPTTLKSAKKMAQLYGGQTVYIQESRDNWYLIRYTGGEGWILAKDMEPIL